MYLNSKSFQNKIIYISYFLSAHLPWEGALESGNVYFNALQAKMMILIPGHTLLIPEPSLAYT